jgi:hypothetical protein
VSETGEIEGAERRTIPASHSNPHMNSFQLVGLPAEPFADLFALPDAQLLPLNIHRMIVDEEHSYPCRISLEDAQIGEEVLLLPFEHQPAMSLYRASGPIYVRRGARQCTIAIGEIPAYVRIRLVSVRAYDTRGWIVDAAVCEGKDVDAKITEMFARPEAVYLHLHNARRGCFSCRVNRA